MSIANAHELSLGERSASTLAITDEDVGVLYRFIADAKAQAEQIAGKPAALEELVELDLAGRDLDVARWLTVVGV